MFVTSALHVQSHSAKGRSKGPSTDGGDAAVGGSERVQAAVRGGDADLGGRQKARKGKWLLLMSDNQRQHLKLIMLLKST